MIRPKASHKERTTADTLESTRTGWALIMVGLALLASAVIIAVTMLSPWEYPAGGILGVPAGIAISLGLIERRAALECRREMHDLTNRDGSNR